MPDSLTFVVSSTLMVFGLSYFLHSNAWLKVVRQLISQGPQLALWAALILIAGLSLISIHNDWTVGWSLVITILGWGMAIKGTVLLLVPDVGMKLFNWSDAAYLKMMRIGGAVYFLLGLGLYLNGRGMI